MIKLFEGYDDYGNVHPNLYNLNIFIYIYIIHVDNDNHFFLMLLMKIIIFDLIYFHPFIIVLLQSKFFYLSIYLSIILVISFNGSSILESS